VKLNFKHQMYWAEAEITTVTDLVRTFDDGFNQRLSHLSEHPRVVDCSVSHASTHSVTHSVMMIASRAFSNAKFS